MPLMAAWQWWRFGDGGGLEVGGLGVESRYKCLVVKGARGHSAAIGTWLLCSRCWVAVLAVHRSVCEVGEKIGAGEVG